MVAVSYRLVAMKVCILQSVLDPFKGGSHLPLFTSLSDTKFVIVCNRSKINTEDLPPNVSVVTVEGRMGSYYYGISDFRFGQLVLKKFPILAPFWKQFDVIHLNQVMGPQFASLQCTGVPIVYAIHHPVTADDQIAREESSALQALQWSMKYFFLKKWQKKLCRSFSHIMTVSETVKKRLIADYGCAESGIHVVPNGVNGELFIPTKHAAEFDIISIGSFVHPRKGFSYLADAYRTLAAGGYDIADVGRRTATQIAILQNIDGVTVHGTVGDERLRELVQRSKVLVSTSLYEGFGLSLIEALSCGRPAFAFAVGAIPEVLLPIDSQLVVPSKNVRELTTRVQAFLSLPETQQVQKGETYRREVLRRYSIEASAEALHALYASLLP